MVAVKRGKVPEIQSEVTGKSSSVRDTGNGAAAGAEAEHGSEQLPAWLEKLRARGLRARVKGVPLLDGVALAVLVLLVAFLWGRAAPVWFWLDEGISAGIASHRLGDIPTLLRQDAAPPLYYLILRIWTSVFGSSDVASHGLSLLFGVAVVPAALWAGWSTFGRRTGWICAVLSALSPYLAFYASETRMYSLVVLLSVLATASFLHAFVFGRRSYLAPFAILVVLLIYTHNWGLLFAVGTVVALVPCLVLSRDPRRLLIDAVLVFSAVGLLYLPWLPTLLYQRLQDGQPWADKPVLLEMRDEVTRLFGGPETFIVIGFGAVTGMLVVLRRPWSRYALSLVVLAVVPLVMLVGGWRSSVFNYRYLAAALGPLLILAAIGLARGGRVALATLWVAAILTAPIGTKGPLYTKSNVQAVALRVAPDLRPRDLVILPDFQMVPLFAHYLPPGLEYANAAGLVPDENIVDWRHSRERFLQQDPKRALAPLLDRLPPGAHLLLACPPVGSSQNGGLDQGSEMMLETTDNKAQQQQQQQQGEAEKEVAALLATVPPEKRGLFHALIRLRCQEVTAMLASDPRFRLDQTLTPPPEVRATSVEGRLFTKV